MQFSEVEKVLRDIVEQNFLHQTVEKQYLNEAQVQYKLAIALYEKGAKDITVEWAVRDSDIIECHRAAANNGYLAVPRYVERAVICADWQTLLHGNQTALVDFHISAAASAPADGTGYARFGCHEPAT